MADNKRISDLTPLPVASGIDLFAIVDTANVITKHIEVSDLMASPGPIGLNNPDQAEFSALILENTPGIQISDFSDDGTLSGANDTEVPTSLAVKSYVDTAVGNAVKLNIIHTSLDSTAVIGDVILADTTGGDISVVLYHNK